MFLFYSDNFAIHGVVDFFCNFLLDVVQNRVRVVFASLDENAGIYCMLN